MDANEITCPKCGHLNNYISEGCVKCGIIFSKYFEMQEREQQQDGGGAPQVASSSEATPVNAVEESPESDTPEQKAIEETLTMDLDTLSSESQEPSAAKTAPVGEKPPQESSEISMAEIEMPVESVAEESEKPADISIASPEAEPQKVDPPDVAEPVNAEAAAPTESTAVETPSDNQIPEMKTEDAPRASEVPAEKAPEPVKSEGSTPAGGALNLGKPLEKEKDNVIPLKAESEPEKPEPLKTQDSTAEKKDAPDQAQAESLPAAEQAAEPAEAPAADAVDAPPAEDEAEILLEEVAQPAKADAAAGKAEDQTRVELLKKQKAALAKAAIAKKQKLAQAKKLEALKKQKVAQAKAEALKRQKAAALKKQKLQARAEALKKQKAAQAEAEASARETQAAVNVPTEIQRPVMAKSEVSNMKIMALLKKYEGRTIGINYDNSADIKEAELVEANDEFFSVLVKETNLQYSYPLQTLLSLIEGEDGVQPDASESQTKYSAVVKVYPLVLF